MAAPSEAEMALIAQGDDRIAAGEGEMASWSFLLAGRLALARGDLKSTAQAMAWSRSALMPVASPAGSLLPNLLLMESELAAELGELQMSARLSLKADQGFAAAGDDDGRTAVAMARGERALRGGNLTAAEHILGLLFPHLDARGDREAGFWLRLRLASALGHAGRRDDAVRLLTDAFGLTEPGSGQRMAAAAETMRLWLDAGQPSDALAIGVTVLEAPASGARELHAEVLVLCAVALSALGQATEAARFAARADGFTSPGLSDAHSRLATARS